MPPEEESSVPGNLRSLDGSRISISSICTTALVYPILCGGIAIALGVGMTLIAPVVASQGSAILLMGTVVTKFTTAAGIGTSFFGVLGRSAEVFAAGVCVLVGAIVVAGAIAVVGAFIIASASIVSGVGNVIAGIGCALAAGGVIHLIYRLNGKYHWYEKIKQRFGTLHNPVTKRRFTRWLKWGTSGELRAGDKENYT